MPELSENKASTTLFKPVKTLISVFESVEKAFQEGKANKARMLANFLHVVVDKAMDGLPVDKALRSTFEEIKQGKIRLRLGDTPRERENSEEIPERKIDLGRILLGLGAEVGLGALSWIVGMGASRVIFGK